MDKFSFIIHPHTLQDYICWFPFTGYLPSTIFKGVTRVLPPFKVSEIKGIQSSFAQVEGEFVCCPLLSEQLRQLPSELVLYKIIKAVKLAERNGAKLVGLSAFSSIMADGGKTVAKKAGIPVTTGDSYNVFMALEGLKEAAKLMEFDCSKINVVVLGATSSIGSVCARILAGENRYLTLVDLQKSELEKLAAQILYETGLAVKVTANIKEALRQADIVFVVTPIADAYLEIKDLKSGAVFYEIARPRNISLKIAEQRKDILVIEGALVDVPGVPEFNFNFGFFSGKCYADMAEVMVLALEKRYESFSMGRDVTLSQVKEIGRIAKKHGFKLAGLYSSGKSITREEIEKVKENVHMKQKGKARVS
ncbi:MAG: shikimate dehydrogenase [Peptococcia bacterium]